MLRPTVCLFIHAFCGTTQSHCMFFFSKSVPGILNEAIPATTQNVDLEIQTSQQAAFRYLPALFS